MAIKIEMLRCFSAVAQTGSLAEAATRLGRTPSAISMTLKHLEEHLGQRLFESDRKNRLTPLGEFVLEQAVTELRQFDSTIQAIETFTKSPKGLIRIATVPSVAGLVFPQAIEQFQAIYPSVSVEMRDMDSAGVLHALTRGQIDIGIATSMGTMRNVHQRVLFHDSFGLLCSNNHPLAKKGGPISLADLPPDQFVRNALCAKIEDDNVQALLSQTRIAAQNTLSLISMIKSQNWITLLPESVVQIDPHQLAFRSLQDLNERRRVDILYRASNHKHDFVRDFAEVLSQTDWLTAAIAQTN